LLQSAPATVRLEVFAIPGDADVDGDVDLADFGILKSHFGTGATRAEGDFSADGRVDLADFAILKVQFGTPYDEAIAELAAARWAASLSQPSEEGGMRAKRLGV
jgi:hypothetical protein